jgi:hypothetical protein
MIGTAYEVENKKIMETVASHIMALVEGKGADNVIPLERPAAGR